MAVESEPPKALTTESAPAEEAVLGPTTEKEDAKAVTVEALLARLKSLEAANKDLMETVASYERLHGTLTGEKSVTLEPSEGVVKVTDKRPNEGQSHDRPTQDPETEPGKTSSAGKNKKNKKNKKSKKQKDSGGTDSPTRSALQELAAMPVNEPEKVSATAAQMLRGFNPLSKKTIVPLPAAFKRMQSTVEDYKNSWLTQQVSEYFAIQVEGVQRNKISFVKRCMEGLGITKPEMKHLVFTGPRKIVMVGAGNAEALVLKLDQAGFRASPFHGTQGNFDLMAKELTKPLSLTVAVRLQMQYPTEHQRALVEKARLMNGATRGTVALPQ